jgi:hypothetical protein
MSWTVSRLAFRTRPGYCCVAPLRRLAPLPQPDSACLPLPSQLRAQRLGSFSHHPSRRGRRATTPRDVLRALQCLPSHARGHRRLLCFDRSLASVLVARHQRASCAAMLAASPLRWKAREARALMIFDMRGITTASPVPRAIITDVDHASMLASFATIGSAPMDSVSRRASVRPSHARCTCCARPETRVRLALHQRTVAVASRDAGLAAPMVSASATSR